MCIQGDGRTVRTDREGSTVGLSPIRVAAGWGNNLIAHNLHVELPVLLDADLTDVPVKVLTDNDVVNSCRVVIHNLYELVGA